MRIIGAVLPLVACVWLSACGGGSGGGNPGSGGGNGTLSLSTTTLNFTANGPTAAAPAPQAVSGTVTGFSGGTLYISIVGTGPGIASISPVTVMGNTGQATVSVPAPSTLGVGVHTAVITVRACNTDVTCATGNLGGSPQTINVNYTVAALQSTVPSFDFTVTNTPTSADLAKQATITGVPVQNWTATSNANWLTVTASGGNGAALNAALVSSVVDGLHNGTYTAAVTVTPGTAGLPLSIPVTLVVKRTQINYVSPYVAYAGTSNDVVIRGEEFSQLTIQNVLFGTTPAQSFTVVSSTELRARYPSTLPLGRHTIGLQSASGFTGIHKLAELAVVNAPAFTGAFLSYPDSGQTYPFALVYDAERATLGVDINYADGNTAFIAFPSSGSVWQAPVKKGIFNIVGMALAADGKEWIGGNNKDVIHFDAGNYSTIATVRSPLSGGGVEQLANFAVASDGTVAMYGDVDFSCGASLILYDARKRVFRNVTHLQCRGTLGAPADGSRLLSSEQFLTSSATMDDVNSINTSTGATTPTGVHLLTGVAPVMNRTGSRIVLDKTRVYDGAYALLGNLPATTEAVVLSPDGSRAYAYEHTGTTSRMITYDLNATPVGGIYPSTGSPVTLPGDPGPQSTSNPASFTNAVVLMAITPNGSTVFIAGSKGVVVQPTP